MVLQMPQKKSRSFYFNWPSRELIAHHRQCQSDAMLWAPTYNFYELNQAVAKLNCRNRTLSRYEPFIEQIFKTAIAERRTCSIYQAAAPVWRAFEYATLFADLDRMRRERNGNLLRLIAEDQSDESYEIDLEEIPEK